MAVGFLGERAEPEPGWESHQVADFVGDDASHAAVDQDEVTGDGLRRDRLAQPLGIVALAVAVVGLLHGRVAAGTLLLAGHVAGEGQARPVDATGSILCSADRRPCVVLRNQGTSEEEVGAWTE